MGMVLSSITEANIVLRERRKLEIFEIYEIVENYMPEKNQQREKWSHIYIEEISKNTATGKEKALL